MWFYANGWKVFNVCVGVTWFPFYKILFDETWNKFYWSISTYKHTYVVSFIRMLVVHIRIHIRCSILSCVCVFLVLVNWMHRLSCIESRIVKKSTNVKELKLNCVLVFRVFSCEWFFSVTLHISFFDFLFFSRCRC